MKYITIPNFEKFQHYKDRRPTWIKLLIEVIDQFDASGHEKKFHGLPDNAKLTFIMLLCLRAHYTDKIPFPSEKWIKERLGLSKITLKPLQDIGFIVIDTETVSKPYQSGTTEREREKEKEKEIYVIFDLARKLFKGTKRGLDAEYQNFANVCNKYNLSITDTVPLLAPAIEREIEHKKNLKDAEKFCPNWKNFQTWVNQRCWTQEFELVRTAGKTEQAKCGCGRRLNSGEKQAGRCMKCQFEDKLKAEAV